MLATPTMVLTTVGHRQQRATVKAEVKGFFKHRVIGDIERRYHHGYQRQPGQWRDRFEGLDNGIDRLVYPAAETADNSQGMAIKCGHHKAKGDGVEAGKNLVEVGCLAGVGANFTLASGFLASFLAFLASWRA